MCLHAMLLRKTALDHVQLALHKKYRNKGRKNVFHKNKQRCRDGAVYLTFVPAWKNELAENCRNKKGYHSMQQPMQVNILWLQDTLATLSPSLHPVHISMQAQI